MNPNEATPHMQEALQHASEALDFHNNLLDYHEDGVDFDTSDTELDLRNCISACGRALQALDLPNEFGPGDKS